MEISTYIHISSKLGYIDKTRQEEMDNNIERISKMLNKLITSLKGKMTK